MFCIEKVSILLIIDIRNMINKKSTEYLNQDEDILVLFTKKQGICLFFS